MLFMNRKLYKALYSGAVGRRNNRPPWDLIDSAKLRSLIDFFSYNIERQVKYEVLPTGLYASWLVRVGTML